MPALSSMAAIWKGSITFGLVNIPVELRTAVRSDHISFRLLHEHDLSPVRYQRVCEKESVPVPWEEIVKGYEYEKGRFVVMTDEDFEAAALESSRTIEILDFVKEDEIDPRYLDKPYYLTPSRAGEKAYTLLREAIRETGMVGVGKVVIRQKQHLTAIKAVGDALMLEIMRFAHELVDASGFNFPAAGNLRPQELEMARQLVRNLAEPFNPGKYTDDYRENLLRIIRSKLKGERIELEAQHAEADSQVVDLMTRLRESLEQGRASGRARKTARKKTAQGASRKSRGTGKRRTA